jgi:hypothetical protein
LPSKQLVHIARKLTTSDVTIVLPDGSYKDLSYVKSCGYKVMVVPTTFKMLKETLNDELVDLVGFSAIHFDKKHSVGARFNVLNQLNEELDISLLPKKLHFLGGSNSLVELILVSPFRNLIHSWDTSMPVWQGHLGKKIYDQHKKDATPVDFNQFVRFSEEVLSNLQWVQDVLEEYYDIKDDYEKYFTSL